MGVAAAKKTGKVLLIEGDGSLIMHIQELETMRRHGIKLLICVLNDGAYGAEIHKLRQDGLDDSGAIFGRTDFASIAKGFGLRGSNVSVLGGFAAMLRDYEGQGSAEIWNIPISDQVTSPTMRRVKIKGHGVV
jgi:thiamine pyrophosphate-dependent acetolactate synthase large subunit-like protein